MAGRDQVDVTGSRLELRAVVHPEAHPSGDEIAEVPLGAQLTFAGALLVLRPAPARLKGGSVERYAAELDEIDATHGHDLARVCGIEALNLWLFAHEGMVGTRFGHQSRAKVRVVAKVEVDRYLAALDEPKRSTLKVLRKSILDVVPEAEQCISYGVPAFKVAGKTVAGFAAFKHHLSYLPHSGSVLSTLADDVVGYETSKGALRFAVDKPLPKHLVKKLITVRMRELGLA